jgi:hypothetical protein
MAKAFTEWKVLPHGPIEKLAENLWWVQGTVPGMSLKRVMTVVRLGDGKLVIHNAIALDAEAIQQLEAWGTPAYLIVPSAIHRLDAPAYKRRYPALRVYAPAGARDKVAEVIPIDGTYADFSADSSVRLEPLQGVADKEGVMLVRSQDGLSVVLNDAVFNMDRKSDLLGFLFTSVLGSAPGPRVSRLAKLALVKDRKQLRADLLRLSALPDLQRLIVAHEKLAVGRGASEALARAAEYL